MAADCEARLGGEPERYPVKTRRTRRTQRENALLLLWHQKRIWLVQRPSKGVWAGLWTLPEFVSVSALDETVAAWPGHGEWRPTIHHVLTHFDWQLHPLRWVWPARGVSSIELPPGRWFTLEAALAMGLPAPVRRLITEP